MYFLDAQRGKDGGYRLSRSADDINAFEVIHLAEGSIAPVACLAEERNSCPRQAACQTLPLWTEYNQLVHDFFHSRKLSDLLPE